MSEETTTTDFGSPKWVNNLKYVKSFNAKLILSSDAVKDFYTIISNSLLKYKKVKAHQSWSGVRFSLGRRHLAIVQIKGKTLNIYLATDPKNHQGKYSATDESAKSKYEQTPALFKIRSEGALKYISRIIDDMAEGIGLKPDPDFGAKTVSDIPAKTFDELIADGEIKVVEQKNIIVDVENVLETEPEEPEIEDIEPETEEYNDETIKIEQKTENIVAPSGKLSENAPDWTNGLKYNKSFTAKLLLGDDSLKDIYEKLYNAITKYDEVREHTNWAGVRFVHGKSSIAFFAIRGKTLNVYLAVNPNDYQGKYKAKDESESKKFSQVPALFKVKSEGCANYLIKVIDKIAVEKNLTPKADFVPFSSSTLPHETVETLLTAGLIRLINGKNVEIEEKEVPNDAPDWAVGMRYIKSFTAKLLLADDDLKEYYAIIRNSILKYVKVKEHISWNYARFSVGRNTVALLAIKGKTLNIYLAVEASAYQGKYKATNESDKPKFAQTPAHFKIKSLGGARYISKVIDEMMQALALRLLDDFEPLNSSEIPSESFEALFAGGYIKAIKGKKLPSESKEAEEAEEVETENVVESEPEQKPQTEQVATNETDKTETLTQTETETIIEESIVHKKVVNFDELILKHGNFSSIAEAISQGTSTIKVAEEKQFCSITEDWVNEIEKRLDAIDRLIRNPSHFIEETEEVLPIEMTKKITGRSVSHLARHTDYVVVEGDDFIPKKMLNVFREDSVLTYENKFLNTLIARLYLFVTKRCEFAEKYGADLKTDSASYTAEFDMENGKGKIEVKVSYSEQVKEPAKKSAISSELRKRVARLRSTINDYANSEFVREMGRNFVNPPILRTNAILKNKYFRECLTLWEYIESYNDYASGITVSEEMKDVSPEYMQSVSEIAAVQYATMIDNASAFTTSSELAEKTAVPEFNPRIILESEKKNSGDDSVNVKNVSSTTEAHTFDGVAKSEDIAFAVKVALAADRMQEDKDLIDLNNAIQEKLSSNLASKVDTKPQVEVQSQPEETTQENTTESENDTNTTEDLTDEPIVDESKIPQIRYRKTFRAKIRLADKEDKERFITLCNTFLKYNKISYRESSKFATIRRGRNVLARILISGKTLKMCFATDINGKPEKYHLKDVSDKKSLADTPAMMKVRSDRALKYAIELAEEIIAPYNLKVKENAELLSLSDIKKIPIKEMIEKRWILVPDGNGLVDIDEDNEEEVPQVEPQSHEQFSNMFTGIRYKKTFRAKIRLADREDKERFITLCNTFLKYNKISYRESSRFATIRRGHNVLARILISGKTLKVCFATDINGKPEKYHLKDVLDKKSLADTPAMMKVRSDRALKYAVELAEELIAPYNLKVKENAELLDVSNIATESESEMLEKRWIIPIIGKAIPEEPIDDVDTEDFAKEVDGKSAHDEPEVEEEKQSPELYTGKPKDDIKDFELTSGVKEDKPKNDEDNAFFKTDTTETDETETVVTEEEIATAPKAKVDEKVEGIVQVAADYSKPTDFGLDSTEGFIKDDEEMHGIKRKRRNFFAWLFGRKKNGGKSKKK